MKTKSITNIQKEMELLLNEEQYLKLTKTLLTSFKNIEIVSTGINPNILILN